MHDDLQFYPTPRTLAYKAWQKFKNKDFSRVLEPSAGEGHLVKRCESGGRLRGYGDAIRNIDVIEVDITKHPGLQKDGFNVVGFDFMKYRGGSIYSHIIMNPPFSEGARHVMHAWDILEEGEIVAILNAETVKNPFSREREMLVRIIEQHGEVEFIQDAFNGPDAERKTDVEVALVWLKKTSAMDRELIGDILNNLQQDTREPGFVYEEMQALALPNSFVENAARTFDAAVEAARQAIIAQARANRYAGMLGNRYEARRSDKGDDPLQRSRDWVRTELGKQYDDLKNRAWSSILFSVNVTSKLSSKASDRVESEFERIKQLEFTAENIYGFLLGLAERQGDIQIDMACDVFDEITKYHTDNTAYYIGWKSNDKHRTCGMRIKTTRFVIPGHKTENWNLDIGWDSRKQLTDFDKVFAMLDGKADPEVSLDMAFRQNFQALRRGARIETSYFDVRYYPGIGTIHFFPKDKALIDRFNRLVGRHRKWLPPEGTKVPEAFWLQYDKAEKFDKEFRAAVEKTKSGWDSPFYVTRPLSGASDAKREEAHKTLVGAMAAVLERNGVNPDALLEGHRESANQAFQSAHGFNRPMLMAA